jgi:hypothetical protein
MEITPIEELYNGIYERQASLSRCPSNQIRNPLDLECYDRNSEMGKFIISMLQNLDKKKKQLHENKKKLEKAGIEDHIQTSDIDIKNFLNNYVLKIDDVNVFLDSATCESPGIACEFLWTLCIYLGLCEDIFPKEMYTPQQGNSNIPSSFKNLNIVEWLQSANINTGSESGYSDITLKKTAHVQKRDVCDPLYIYEDPSYILIQSKFINDEFRSVANDYDIAKLNSLKAYDNKDFMLHYGNSTRFVLLVKDKQIVIDKVSKLKRSSRHLFLNFNTETDIYDSKDLEKYYRKLKFFLQQFKETDPMQNTQVYNFSALIEFYNTETKILIPRLHQLITLFKTVQRLENSSRESSNTFLYGAVARSGKTYMMGELINYFNIMGKQNKNYRCYEPVPVLPGYDKTKPFSFIIFSPVPNETITEYRNLFSSYKEFKHYTVVVLQGSVNFNRFIEEYNPQLPYIIIISKQTLDVVKKVSLEKKEPARAHLSKQKQKGVVHAEDEDEDNVEDEEDKDPDHEDDDEDNEDDDEVRKQKEEQKIDEMIERLGHLLSIFKKQKGEITGIFFDEHHVGGCSEKSKKMLERFKRPDMFPNLFYVFITATYNKSIFNYKIPSENIFTWNYEDIILSKELTNEENYKKLLQYHGQSFDRAIECFKKMNYDIKDIEEEYKKFPEIHVLTHKWNQQLIRRQLERGGHEIIFGELLRVDPKTNEFVDVNGVNGLLTLIFGNMREFTPFMDENRMCFFNRIKRISDRIGTRTLRDDSFTTQLWFLPIGTKGTGIENIANALEKKLNDSMMIKNNYAVFNMKSHKLVRGDQSFSYKQQIASEELKAKQAGYKGLIILTGKQLSLGISLPCVDIVIMLNDLTGLDLYYQMIFRALTESSGKSAGFICDFNPDRTVSAIYGQAMRPKGNDPKEDAQQKFLKENFIYLDSDLVEEKNITTSELIDFFKSIQLTDIDGKNLLSTRTMNDINKELKQIIDNLEMHDIQSDLAQLGFDKVVMSENIKKNQKVEEKVSKGEARLQELKDQEEQILQLSKQDSEQRQELEKIRKKKAAIEKKLVKDMDALTELDTIIKIGDIAIIIIKLAALLTFDAHSQIKSLNDIFTIIYNEDIIQKRAESSIKTRLDNMKEYLYLLGIFGIDKNQRLEYNRINYMLELFNPGNEKNIINRLGIIDIVNTNIENLQLDIKQQATDAESSIEEIEKVMTKRCTKQADGSLVVIENPLAVSEGSVDTLDTVGESCDQIPSILQKKRLLKYIEENLTPIEELKKATGEVFTPWGLVDEMMHTIPSEFWKNPEHKILEPGSGFGPFAIWAYYRLMVGLKDVIPDEEDRRKHIVENMLFMAELNGVNVDICRTIFSSNGLYRVNIYHGDFLELNPVEEWGVRGFDLICGNPPWNNSKDGTQKGSRAKNSLWDKFIFKSLDFLKKNGYLGFINPAQWRGLGPEYHKVYDAFKSRQLLYLHIFSKKQGNELFNIGSRFDIFVLHNKENTKPCKIIDEMNETHYIKINDWHFLPNYNFKNIEKIMTDEEHGINIIHDYFYSNVSKIISYKKIGEFKYEVVHGITLDGLKCLYTNDNTKGHFGIPKVLLNFNEQQYPVNDYEGKYGMSQMSFGIPITSKKEGDDIVEAINTEEFKEIIKATKWGAFQTDWRMFKYFRPDFYKDFIGKTKKKQQLSQGVSAQQQPEDEHTETEYDGQDEEDDDVTEDDEDFTFSRGAVAAQHFPKEDDEQEAMQACLDSSSSAREFNAKLKYFTETICDVVYLFNKEHDNMPCGYLSYGKPSFFSLDLTLEFDRCLQNNTSASCIATENCKWVRARAPNPGRCELKEYPVKAELTKYSNYFAKSRKQSAGKNNRKSKRPQKLKISKKRFVDGKNYRKSKRNLKY